jgi:triosephosphate isomerase
MTNPEPLIVGNWKMNGVSASLAEARAIAAGVGDARARVVLCPPCTLLDRMAAVFDGTPVQLGGQDNHWSEGGAFTGDVSAEMLADAGASLVILGHSERRSGHLETDALVASKVREALKAGLEPIICVRETLAEREDGRTLATVTTQAAVSVPGEIAGRRFSIAYEPVWAIGSGVTPTLSQIEEVHRAIRAVLVDRFGQAGGSAPILYGGSVSSSKAAEILHANEVGGVLVGGASRKAEDFLAIIHAL